MPSGPAMPLPLPGRCLAGGRIGLRDAAGPGGYGAVMAVQRDTISFEASELGPVADAMRELTARGDGEGWINIGPELSDVEAARVPQRSVLGAWFSGRGPALAMATWAPATRLGRAKPAQLGIEHGSGPDALARLREHGLALPAGWLRRQDHAKHGLVIDLPDDAAPEAILVWAIAAVELLQTADLAPRRWIAAVHRPQ